MKLIGLTGGVGMGKSTAAKYFLQQGARVIDTDEIAHELVRPGQPALTEITREFGDAVLNADGSLNRAALAELVFTDAAARHRLEAILHPRIRERWQAQVAEWRKAGCELAVVVIPLLFETQTESCFDKIVCVACSNASQHERLLARRWTHEQITRRIAAQWPVEQKMGKSHIVIWTEGDPEVHRRQVAEILPRL